MNLKGDKNRANLWATVCRLQDIPDECPETIYEPVKIVEINRFSINIYNIIIYKINNINFLGPQRKRLGPRPKRLGPIPKRIRW